MVTQPVISICDEIAAYLEWGNSQGGRLNQGWDAQHALLCKNILEWWRTKLNLESLANIKLESVENVMREQKEAGLASKTILLKIQHLKALINWSIRRHHLAANPLLGLGKLDGKARDPHRALNDSEVAALLHAAPGSRQLWYETGLATGFRVNELRLIRVRDLDVDALQIFQPAEFSKDRKEHRQPIEKGLAERLASIGQGKKADDRLLEIPTSKAWKIFKTDCERAGIAGEVSEQVGGKTIRRKATWHSLRKVFITNLFKSGLDLKTIQTLGRLSSAELAVQTYAASVPENLRAGASAAMSLVRRAVGREPSCASVRETQSAADVGECNRFCSSGLQEFIEIGATGHQLNFSAKVQQRHRTSRG